jgi:YVTN family beta-propeller protein
MSADSVSPSTQPARPGGRPARRRRIVKLSWVAGLSAVALALPAGAYAIAGGFAGTSGSPVNAAQHAAGYQAGQKFTLQHAAAAKNAKNAKTANAAAAGTDYTAYVAAAGGFELVEVDVATDTILKTFAADTPEGVAATPDGSQVFIAETGQYHVIALNPATGTETPIYVGPYPQDVAVSPDGSQAYAAVTGGDTGPGGSDVVAVIATASDQVTRDIKVGPGPRQVVFSPDGTRAYVTTETGVSVINTGTGRVIDTIGIRSGAQGIAVSPVVSTLYVTSPATGTLSGLAMSRTASRSRRTARSSMSPT